MEQGTIGTPRRLGSTPQDLITHLSGQSSLQPTWQEVNLWLCQLDHHRSSHRKSDTDNVHISRVTFTAKEKEEDITKCVNLRHLSLLCIQLYRQGGQEAYFQGKLYGEAGHYYHRYPATVFFHISPTEEEEEEEEEDALVLLIEIIMRPVGEFMGHPVIIRSLKPTNNLLSPRSWRWRGWGWGWWGCGWYWQCRCASDGCPIIRSLSRAKTFSPVSIFHKHNYNEDLVARWQNCFSFSVF